MTKKELAKEIGKRVREIRELYYSVFHSITIVGQVDMMKIMELIIGKVKEA